MIGTQSWRETAKYLAIFGVIGLPAYLGARFLSWRMWRSYKRGVK